MTTLLQMWLDKKEFFEGKTVDQILGITGTGSLIDGNATSIQLREFFGSVPSTLLFEYIGQCLQGPFEQSGYVLQDLINQLGSRLGYGVSHGYYRGSTKRIGSDGLWKAVDEHHLVVEVKTTDAYQINLDVLANYRQKLVDAGTIPQGRSSILVVVGRTDTGGLEAQTRGSRHAWDIRLVSVEGLITLLKVKENLNDLAIVRQTQEILKPLEFTRLDSLIEIIFKTSVATEILETDEAESEVDLSNSMVRAASAVQPANYHRECIPRIEQRLRVPLIRQGHAAYASADGEHRVICLVSKEYRRSTEVRYWYAFHPAQREFIEKGKKSYVALGCGSSEKVLLLPASKFLPLLTKMRTTKTQTKIYWHVEVFQKGERLFLISTTASDGIDVTRYLV